MKIKIGNIIINADGYIPIPEENMIRFYRNKSILDYIPPIKVNANILSDFGKNIFFNRK